MACSIRRPKSTLKETKTPLENMLINCVLQGINQEAQRDVNVPLRTDLKKLLDGVEYL